MLGCSLFYCSVCSVRHSVPENCQLTCSCACLVCVCVCVWCSNSSKCLANNANYIRLLFCVAMLRYARSNHAKIVCESCGCVRAYVRVLCVPVRAMCLMCVTCVL